MKVCKKVNDTSGCLGIEKYKLTNGYTQTLNTAAYKYTKRWIQNVMEAIWLM